MVLRLILLAALMTGTVERPAVAAPLACEMQRVCSNDAPCVAVSIDAQILPVRGTLLFSLQSETPVVLSSQDTSEDIVMRGTAQDGAGKSAYMLSLFSDHTLIYSTHTFVGQAVSVTMLGTCQRNKT